jgi:transposase
MRSCSAMKRAAKEVRGAVRDVARTLLDGGRSEELLALVDTLASRNEALEQLVASIRNARNKAERVPAGQLELLMEKLREATGGELTDADKKLVDEAAAQGKREQKTDPAKQPAVRRPPPTGARRVPNDLRVPHAERACPACGAERKCVGHETTEVVDLIPAEVIVRLDRREVLACDACDAEMVRAPMGDKVVVGGAYGSRLVSELVVNKYWNGLPLNRQGEMLSRLGLEMPSSSMGDQIQWATDLLRPIYRFLLAKALCSVVLHVDATSLPVKDKDAATGLTIGSLWGYVGDQTTAVMLYTRTGKKVSIVPGEIGPEQFLEKRRGFVVADAAGIFDASFRRPDLIEVGCNMHARRYFVKALEAGDARAAPPIAAFKALYDVESDAREMSPHERLGLRQQRSKRVLDELGSWCRTYQAQEPPSSLLAKAVSYFLNHEVALTRFLDDGRLPIDNGIVERLHRRPAVGRRNYLFAGSHSGAERAAVAYSIIATCCLEGIDPVQYLADVLPRLARGIVVVNEAPLLAPSAWKAMRTATSSA